MNDNVIMEENTEKKLKWFEYLICGWAFILILYVGGGFIGGGLGGLAYYYNSKIYLSERPLSTKILYVILIGLGAFLLYIAIVTILILVFPDFFTGKPI